MRTLHLVLKSKWYDMFDSGEKKEEYRALTPYWIKRLQACETYLSGIFEECLCNMCATCECRPTVYPEFHLYKAPLYDMVCFHRGYTSETITFKIDGIKIGVGKKEWGAPDDPCLIISTGKLICKTGKHDNSDRL